MVFRCPECNYQFARFKDRYSHIKSEHVNYYNQYILGNHNGQDDDKDIQIKELSLMLDEQKRKLAVKNRKLAKMEKELQEEKEKFDEMKQPEYSPQEKSKLDYIKKFDKIYIQKYDYVYEESGLGFPIVDFKSVVIKNE